MGSDILNEKVPDALEFRYKLRFLMMMKKH